MSGLLVLTPNPAVDIVYRVPPHGQGETVRVLEVLRRAGGKGVNVASVAGQLRCAAHCLLPLGGATGAWITRDLAERAMASTVVTIAAPSRSTLTIVDGVGHPTVYAEPGPFVGPDELATLTESLDRLSRDAEMVIIAGSLSPGIDGEAMCTWLERVGAAGIPSLVDTSGPTLRAAARAGATIVKANEAELLDATGSPDAERGAQELLALGAELVLLSRGSAGLVAFDRTDVVAMPGVPGVVGNPTGAGDAATAAFAAAYLEHLPMTACLHRAAAAGAAAVLSPVAGDIPIDAYTSFLEQDPLRWTTP